MASFSLKNAGGYVSSFLLLSRDLMLATEYLEPVDVHEPVFSHRLYELLLRASTEFESIARDLLESSGYPKNRDQLGIVDYKTLEAQLRLEVAEVGVQFWQPAPIYLRPFEDWSVKTPALPWYAAYNKVKHNRSDSFPSANLRNTVLSVSAVFAVLAELGVFPLPPGFMIRNAGGYSECVYPSFAFTFRKPTP